jgi:hypothetical protein
VRTMFSGRHPRIIVQRVVPSLLGTYANASQTLFPVNFNFSMRSREVMSMSRDFIRSGLLPSGPCPATILVLLSARERILSAAASMPVIVPRYRVDVGLHAVEKQVAHKNVVSSW